MRKETKAQFAKVKNIKKKVSKIRDTENEEAKTLGLDIQQDVSAPLYDITVSKDMLYVTELVTF